MLDSRIMGVLTPMPSIVNKKFMELYKESPKKATDYLYKLSGDVNYIRTSRIKKDIRYKADTPYGKLDITINLSKPEKDPNDIAAAKLMPQTSYPRCLLCKENVGFAGNLNKPARQNIRIVPLTLDNKKWYLQYSPYSYYNEHCIVLSDSHSPMTICESTFRKLLDFVEKFPHYFIGSNADLPIVGGSILSHEHFQGESYTFAMNKASDIYNFNIPEYSNVEASIVKWPLSVIRLKGKYKESLVKCASHILSAWRKYSDSNYDILAYTSDTMHNTITPIARYEDGNYVFDLVLRNNRTIEEYPLGIFHPHQEYHHIKKENIGLIEVMGLAVLPKRLLSEISDLKNVILNNLNIDDYPNLLKHKDWYLEMINKYDFTKDNIDSIIKQEVANIFVGVLSHAGVYKQTKEGIEGFIKFTKTL